MKTFLRFLLVLAVLLVGLSPSDAWFRGQRQGATGNSTLNIGSGQTKGYNFLNIMKVGAQYCQDVLNLAKFDDDQMPVGTLTGSGGCGIANIQVFDEVQYRVIIPAGTSGRWGFSLGFAAGAKSCTNLSNVTIVSGCSGTFVVWESTNGAGGSFDFTADTATGPALFFIFDNAGTFTHTLGTEMAIVRVSDVPAYTQYLVDGLNPFTPEFIASITPLNSLWVRTMGWVLTSFGGPYETTWATRNKPTTAAWAGRRFPAGYIPEAGGSCGAALICNTGNAYSADPGSLHTGSWQDGEAVIGKVQAANTGAATFVINDGRSAKSVCNSFGTPAVSDEISNAGSAGSIWIYNATLDCVVMTSQGSDEAGIPAALPIEIRIAVANLVNANYWHTYPLTGTDDYFTQEHLKISALLNPALLVNLELSNEVWNPAFNTYSLASSMGYKYGWPLGGGANNVGWQGYRSLQIFRDLVPVDFAGMTDRVIPYAGFQACCMTVTSPSKRFLLDGVNLKPNVQVTTTVTITGSASPCTINWPFNDWSRYDPWPVSFSGGTIPAAITPTTIYYTVPSSFANQLGPSATFQIATSEANARAGTVINCATSSSGTVTGSYVNTLYQALAGNNDYTAFPNRPVDYYKRSGAAPYAGGTMGCNHTDNGCVLPTDPLPAYTLPYWQALVDAAALGDWTTTRAMIDKDVRSGRRWLTIQNVTCSGSTITTAGAHGITAGNWVAFEVTGGTMCSGLVANKTYYVSSTPLSTTLTVQPFVNGEPSGVNVSGLSNGTGTTTIGVNTNSGSLIGVVSRDTMRNDAVARTYNGARPVGMDDLLLAQYEGNLEINAITAAQCTALGITGHTAADCAQLSLDAVDDFLINSTQARQLTYDYYACTIGILDTCVDTYNNITNSRFPAWLVLSCGGQYALIAGGAAGSGGLNCEVTDPPNPKRQYYYGVQDFNAATIPPLP